MGIQNNKTHTHKYLMKNPVGSGFYSIQFENFLKELHLPHRKHYILPGNTLPSWRPLGSHLCVFVHALFSIYVCTGIEYVFIEIGEFLTWGIPTMYNLDCAIVLKQHCFTETNYTNCQQCSRGSLKFTSTSALARNYMYFKTGFG